MRIKLIINVIILICLILAADYILEASTLFIVIYLSAIAVNLYFIKKYTKYEEE